MDYNISFGATVSFWDKISVVSGLAILFLLMILYLLKRPKKEKLALANIDHFMNSLKNDKPDGNLRTMENQIQYLKWKHPEMETFVSDYVNPYTAILREINVFDAIIKLLDMLDKEGHCSSIARRYKDLKTDNGAKDLEAAEWQSNQLEAYDILCKNVSLLEHTLNVASILIEKRKKESKDFQMEMGRLLIVSLGHDIGKIPSTGKAHLNKDHFMISHNILNDILPTDYPSRDEILIAVRDHHFPSASSGTLLNNLKMADHKARQLELKKYGYKPITEEPECKSTEGLKAEITQNSHKPQYNMVDLSWLDLSQLLQRICDRINIVENGKYEAFSHSGIVYVYPRLIAKYACDLAIQAARPEIMAYMANEENMSCLEFALRQALSEHIPDKLIGVGYIGRKFQIMTQDGTLLNPGFYIPLKITAFKQASSTEIERRKQSVAIFRSIRQVLVYNQKTLKKKNDCEFRY